MLQYGGYTWLLDVRDSPIEARIGPGCRAADDVRWQVTFHYLAAGQEWRRVKSWLRPTLRLCVYDFRPPAAGWEELEGQSFSSDEEGSCGGTLFIESTHGAARRTELACGLHRLHFVRRRDFWFTTELVALPNEGQRTTARTCAIALANGDADPACECPIGESHDENAIYIVEDIPFGLVEVAAPANARCPWSYARAKARAFTGLKNSTEVDVGPSLATDGKDWRSVAGADARVRLHHGARWTHFIL
jgi:hypothetical protein